MDVSFGPFKFFWQGHPTVCPLCGQHLLEGWSNERKRGASTPRVFSGVDAMIVYPPPPTHTKKKNNFFQVVFPQLGLTLVKPILQLPKPTRFPKHNTRLLGGSIHEFMQSLQILVVVFAFPHGIIQPCRWMGGWVVELRCLR